MIYGGFAAEGVCIQSSESGRSSVQLESLQAPGDFKDCVRINGYRVRSLGRGGFVGGFVTFWVFFRFFQVTCAGRSFSNPLCAVCSQSVERLSFGHSLAGLRCVVRSETFRHSNSKSSFAVPMVFVLSCTCW